MSRPVFASFVLVAAASRVLAADPDPAALLKGAAGAIEKAHALSYSAIAEVQGPLAKASPKRTALVTLARAEAGGWKIRVEGDVRAGEGAPVPLHVGFDGASAWSLQDAEKVASERDAGTTQDLREFFQASSADALIAWEAIAEKPLDVGTKRLAYEGAGDVGGVPCSVVRIGGADDNDAKDPKHPAPMPMPGDDGEVLRIFIANADHLPRRIERIAPTADASGAPAKNVRSLVMSELKVDGDVAPAGFALTLPDGYRVKAVAPKRADADKPKPGGGRGGVGPVQRGGILAPGAAAPAWTLKDPEGKDHSLADDKGKLVLVDFWATWCGPCKAAMPGIQKIHEKYKSRGVQVFGISVWEQGDPAKYMKDKKYTYGLLLKGDDAAKQYGVAGIPAIFLIGGDGKILYSGMGSGQDAVIEQAIEDALKKRGN